MAARNDPSRYRPENYNDLSPEEQQIIDRNIIRDMKGPEDRYSRSVSDSQVEASRPDDYDNLSHDEQEIIDDQIRDDIASDNRARSEDRYGDYGRNSDNPQKGDAATQAFDYTAHILDSTEDGNKDNGRKSGLENRGDDYHDREEMTEKSVGGTPAVGADGQPLDQVTDKAQNVTGGIDDIPSSPSTSSGDEPFSDPALSPEENKLINDALKKDKQPRDRDEELRNLIRDSEGEKKFDPTDPEGDLATQAFDYAAHIFDGGPEKNKRTKNDRRPQDKDRGKKPAAGAAGAASYGAGVPQELRRQGENPDIVNPDFFGDDASGTSDNDQHELGPGYSDSTGGITSPDANNSQLPGSGGKPVSSPFDKKEIDSDQEPVDDNVIDHDDTVPQSPDSGSGSSGLKGLPVGSNESDSPVESTRFFPFDKKDDKSSPFDKKDKKDKKEDKKGISPFAAGAGAAGAGAALGAGGAAANAANEGNNAGAAGKPSPFSEAKNAFGDGGGGVNPALGSGSRGRGLANREDAGLPASSGGGGGKPPANNVGGGALPPGGDNGKKGSNDPKFHNPMKKTKWITAAIIGTVLAVLLTMLTGPSNNTSMSEGFYGGGGPMTCAMETQDDSFRSGVRGVPDGEYSKPLVMPPAQPGSPYGPRDGGQHNGLDIPSPDGTSMYAFEDGVVLYAQKSGVSGFGGWIVLDHFETPDGDFASLYGHMYPDAINLSVGDDVKAGEQISEVGNAGESRGSHLHFEIHPGGYDPDGPVDPLPWVEKAVNPGNTDSRQSVDRKDDEEKEAKEASASSGERVLKSSYDHDDLPTDNASSVQYGSKIGSNPNRTLIVTSPDYTAYSDRTGLEQTVSLTMKETDIHFLDDVYYDKGGAEKYHRGRWEGPYGPGMKFVPAAQDIAKADGGYKEALEYLQSKDSNSIPVYKKYGKVVIATADSKRYKPDPMPKVSQPGLKDYGFVPDPDNWVDPGWPGPDGSWIPNHQYLPEASIPYPDQHNTAKGAPVYDGGGWNRVAEKELEELKKLLADNDVDLYMVTGAGQYAYTPEGKNQSKETTGTNNNYILGIFDEKNIVRWDQYFDNSDLYRPEDNPNPDNRKYSEKVGGLNENGTQKFVDSIRTVAWNEDRSKLPAGKKSVKSGDKKLPGKEYKSPYRGSKKGSRKLEGYEGGYKITGGENMTHDAMTIAQAIQEQFPEVQTIGGWRPDGGGFEDHPSGRAVDIMIPDYKTTKGKNLGKEIDDYLHKNSDFFNIDYSIWAQEYRPAVGEGNKMEDRGSETANHYDHVHVTVNKPADQNKGSAKDGGRNSFGYATADESHYYGEFPERDGSPMSARRGNGVSTCCPSLNETGNSDRGNFSSEGNLVDPSDIVLKNSALIIESGKELGFSDNEIITALMVASRESNFLNYANNGANWAQSGSSDVPPEVLRESLKYPYDAVGQDAASVGIFQQQILFWGEVEDLMIPAFQTGQFYQEMRRLNAGDDGYDLNPGKDRGLAGSTIQVNRDGRGDYDSHEGLAENLFNSYKGDKPLSNNDKKDLKRGWDNRRMMTGAAGEETKENQGDKSTSSSNSNARNTSDRSLNGGCGVSNSIRRHNQVRYNEGDARTIVEAARDQIGTPYSWGGGTVDGPSEGFGEGAGIVGFDCSSLVMYAADKAGITLPRTTEGQIGAGKKIGSLEDAKPGDLIFWPGHVAIYIGDDKIIHAPTTGDVVKEANMYDHGGVTGIRRIVE